MYGSENAMMNTCMSSGDPARDGSNGVSRNAVSLAYLLITVYIHLTDLLPGLISLFRHHLLGWLARIFHRPAISRSIVIGRSALPISRGIATATRQVRSNLV